MKIKILILLFLSINLFAQKEIRTSMWNNKIRDSIIVFQNVNNDSTSIYINKKDNGWLKEDVKLKTVNYWINAPIELSSRFQNNTLILTRSFIGNNIVGDHILFKRKKYKYYFSELIEFEQK